MQAPLGQLLPPRSTEWMPWTGFALQDVKRLSLSACAAGAAPVVCESALGHQDGINGSQAKAGRCQGCLFVCLSRTSQQA